LRKCDVTERLPFDDCTFDYVLSIELFRYLPDSRRTIQEMFRVLRPGGTCLVTALPRWNSNAYWLVNRLAGVFASRKLSHLRQFFTTSGQLRRQFAEAGFAEVKVQGIYTGPVNWVERLARPLLPSFLRTWEPIDRRLANAGALREFSNMFLVCARRGEL
jgi:ubiquinone/menaquinone biosynthesis C-methylase UbiE